ncbi:OmpA family protein [Pedobacter sp. L105]|uniref:OmpA family protein n=1 Tax=Pedobacter sp. L105 TaxID=1641871 RepID=UPI00131D4B03|nr:OmpA family protein [Pedobacter sp. L105]
MRILKSNLLLVLIALSVFSLQACKAKKMVVKPKTNPQVETPKAAPVEKPQEAPVAQAAPAPEKPNFNFNPVLFEFNSGVLKTASFAVLDQVAAEMKKDPSVKFTLNGNSSAEGTVEHNMSLSVDRANAVKSYLVNAGINAANLSVKGFGATVPIASNDTEEGREQNRRVEFKVNP